MITLELRSPFHFFSCSLGCLSAISLSHNALSFVGDDRIEGGLGGGVMMGAVELANCRKMFTRRRSGRVYFYSAYTPD